MLSVHIRRVVAMVQATFLSISLLLSVTCSGKREGARRVTTVRTSPGVVPGGLSVRKTFLNVISSVPLKPVPRPLPPELGSGGNLVSARFDYEVAVQKYAVAQLRGLDEETERALRRRVPQTGWTELGFVPFALVSYEAATIRSAGSFAFVRLRVDRGDPWNPEWTTYFGEVAVQCRPKPMRFQLVTLHAGQEKAVSATYDEKEPTRVAARGAVIAKLCSELRLPPASNRR